MSKRKRKKMNEQITNTPETTEARKLVGYNPDGTPIYAEEASQGPEHTGAEVPPTV